MYTCLIAKNHFKHTDKLFSYYIIFTIKIFVSQHKDECMKTYKSFYLI